MPFLHLQLHHHAREWLLKLFSRDHHADNKQFLLFSEVDLIPIKAESSTRFMLWHAVKLNNIKVNMIRMIFIFFAYPL